MPPVTLPVTLYSVSPAAHLLGVTGVALRDTLVVFLLGAHVAVPVPDANDEDLPVADLYWAFKGVHDDTVKDPEIVPVSLWQATLEWFADAFAGPLNAAKASVAPIAIAPNNEAPTVKRRMYFPLSVVDSVAALPATAGLRNAPAVEEARHRRFLYGCTSRTHERGTATVVARDNQMLGSVDRYQQHRLRLLPDRPRPSQSPGKSMPLSVIADRRTTIIVAALPRG